MPRIHPRLAATAVALSLSLAACSGSGPAAPPATATRTVRYELSGTYSKPLSVLFTSTSGATNTLVDVPSLPWSREVTYPASVLALGFNVQSVAADTLAKGLTVTARVLSGGRQVATGSATANSLGLVNIPTLTYVFP